jgi:hypothetical protein
MWTREHRRAADCRGLRYPSDLTDAEWALIEPGDEVLDEAAQRLERYFGKA